MKSLTRLVLERLLLYYRFLSEATARKPLQTITSSQIAAATDQDPTQVRKDLGAIGLLGMSRVGFDVCEICRAVRTVLGFDRDNAAVLLGAGHLGGALVAYSGFDRYGLNIVAAFDNDPRKVGTRIAGCQVRSLKSLKPYVRRHRIRMAIVTTPVEVSQKLTDRLVEVGVKAIWNFTSARLTAPPDVLIRDEHISVGLAEISYHLRS